jgi:hypothetical protein
VGTWDAHRLRVVRATPARGTIIEANAAGAGDGKPPGGVINERGGVGLRMDGGSGEGMDDGGTAAAYAAYTGDGARRVRGARQAEVWSGVRRGRT